MSAFAVLVVALLALAALGDQLECRVTQVPHTSGDKDRPSSWIIEDSKGCGFNKGIDPVYVMSEWCECTFNNGYDYTDSECVVWDIKPEPDSQ